MSESGSRWIDWSRYVLIFVGVAYLGLGVVMAPLYTLILSIDGEGGGGSVVMGLVLGAMMLGLGVVFGALNFAAAWGLKRQAKWAWVLTVFLGVLYLPSGCLPFGAVLLYAMLSAPGRARFGM